MHKRTRWIWTTGLMLTLGMGVAFAGQRDSGHRRGGGHSAMGHNGGHSLSGAMLSHWADELDLGDTQRADLEALIAREHEALMANREELGSARQALHQQIQNEVFDEGAIRDKVAELSRIEADHAVAAADVLRQARAILTPEQVETVQQLLAEHEASRAERRQYHHERFGSDTE